MSDSRLNQMLAYSPAHSFTTLDSHESENSTSFFDNGGVDKTFEMEMNANFLFAKTIWLGASYRLNDSVSGLIQYQMTRQMKLGVAYDYGLSDLNKHNIGTFEVLMEYFFDFENDKIIMRPLWVMVTSQCQSNVPRDIFES